MQVGWRERSAKRSPETSRIVAFVEETVELSEWLPSLQTENLRTLEVFLRFNCLDQYSHYNQILHLLLQNDRVHQKSGINLNQQ
jgi:hypothetical protein